MLNQSLALCNGCAACAAVCPKGAISMEPNNEGFLYPQINSRLCVSCGLCEERCPIIRKYEPGVHDNIIYAVMNTDESIRKLSSSGGVFRLLAEKVLLEDGIVFGAKFDENFSVVHGCAEKLDDLEALQGSKYVQSKIGDSYQRVKQCLESKRLVLFSGTPCQIAGLKSYLHQEHENLYCVDIVCHGVPSPKVWEKYCKENEEATGSKIQYVSFRDKSTGWRDYHVTFRFRNGTMITKHHSKDAMMKAFIQNICLRNSCYQCKFKGIAGQSDITLADFWGIERVLPYIDDDIGTTLMVSHTAKGRRLFNAIRPNVIYEKINAINVLDLNPMMVDSASRHPKRNEFFMSLDTEPFESIVKRYCKEGIIAICKQTLLSRIDQIRRMTKCGGEK